MADTVECVVVGAGIIGLAVARCLALPGREVLVLEQERVHRRAHLLAQQRGDPCRALLSQGQSQGAVLRRGQPAALRLLRRARHRRQAHRQAGGGGATRARPRRSAGLMAKAAANGVGDLEWLERRSGARARARSFLRCRVSFAFDRHHRQPRADAGLSGRCGECRRQAGAARRVLGGRVDIAGFDLEVGGDEQDRARMRDPGQCRRALRAVPGAAPRRRAAATSIPRDYYLPRRLFHAVGPRALPAPDLSGAGTCGAGRPLHRRSRRPGASSAPTPNGSAASTTPSIRNAAICSTPPSANTGRA